jgi:signal transduction histidine kinase
MQPLLERIGRFVSASLRFGEPQRPERRQESPATLMLQARDALRARWAALGAAPVVDAPSALPTVLVDSSQILEALLELLQNALEAVGDPRRIHLAAAVQRATGEGRGHVRLEVRDDGPGISAADLRHVFDPFFTTKPKATGLGLSVAQTLVRENGGRLLARSTPGFETVFAIVLPEAP